MNTLKNDLKNKKFSNIYLFKGEEEFLKKLYVNLFKQSILRDGDELNYTVYSDDRIDIEDFISTIQTMPFLADNRLVIVKNSGFFNIKSEEIIEALEKIPSTTILIFSEEKVDARKGLYKFVNKKGKIATFDKPTLGTTADWVQKEFKKNDKIISNKLAHILVTNIGCDMYLLTGEIEKLIAYAGDRKEITEDDLKKISSSTVADHIFEMIDALAGKNTDRFVNLYEELLLLKEAPIKILALIVRHFNILLLIKESNSNSDKDLASITKVSPYFIKKYKAQAINFDKVILKKIVDDGLETDLAIKTGIVSDRIGVEKYIISVLNVM